MKIGNIEISNFTEVVLDRTYVWKREGMYWWKVNHDGCRDPLIEHEIIVGMIKAFANKADYKVVESIGTINIFKR
jgi:hypothetical protein